MSDEQHHTRKDPDIFKHLSPKTQGYLRASANKREEQSKLNDDNMSTEQTFIAIKPDGVQVCIGRSRDDRGNDTDCVQRGLIGPIISRFEARGYKLAAIKLMTASQEHLEKHYEDLSSKPFFPGLIKYMGSGPICAMVWEGRDAVKTGRVLLGATNPLASAPGTIRGDYAIDVGRNVCHGSDSVENAKKEIALWFKEGEVQSWKSAQHDWVYEK
ncbi:nucleoside diphosphate kinase, variant 2 [Cadophora gregata]|uniref:nucleoside diphosphate kinase, variant 2 n=1 Tax=Cadophora gregata TaxID=51156 RepID=UPI0026DD7E09|nr:nucleoside diphosphate kinase, variant 2 [Cadophora gregata]KAK0128754.1 nucleoside diphosphate kinase, variant 2 [Cadophora gregata]